MRIPRELERAAEFHTHLGPYLVVGLRMGRAVTRALGEEPFTIRIVAHTGPKPPYSCTVDGIQLATPCTTGNGGLEVAPDRTMSIEATRRDGRALTVSLRDEVFERIESGCAPEDQEVFACEIWEMPEARLLAIEERTVSR